MLLRVRLAHWTRVGPLQPLLNASFVKLVEAWKSAHVLSSAKWLHTNTATSVLVLFIVVIFVVPIDTFRWDPSYCCRHPRAVVRCLPQQMLGDFVTVSSQLCCQLPVHLQLLLRHFSWVAWCVGMSVGSVSLHRWRYKCSTDTNIPTCVPANRTRQHSCTFCTCNGSHPFTVAWRTRPRPAWRWVTRPDSRGRSWDPSSSGTAADPRNTRADHSKRAILEVHTCQMGSMTPASITHGNTEPC
mmetsp:Transcript_548/g.880  ORF Transcript_548/g.880 Transcript_548/m.880 type:complete len:242 (+) Transcript_548:179-904(+)